MNSGITLSDIDTESLDRSAKEQEEYLLQEQKSLNAQQEAEQLQLDQEEQAKAEQKDPRNKKNWGTAGLAKEAQSIVTGGIQDTASSIATLPERYFDMFSGEMSKQGKAYRPDWDPFVDEDNPIESRTWWGGALRGFVHFGTLAAGIALGSRFRGAKPITTRAGQLWRAAKYGAYADLISKYSQDDNALGVVRDRFGFIDTPLSTKDTDHPLLKTFKNVAEGTGIGTFTDVVGFAVGKGYKRIRPGTTIEKPGIEIEVEKATARQNSVDAQVQEAAQLQLDFEEFGGYKNKPIADPWQGSPTSKGNTYEAKTQLKRTRIEWGAEEGSTDSITTPVQLQRWSQSSGLGEKELTKVAKDLMSDSRFQTEVAALKAGRLTMGEVWGDALELHQQTVVGRNALDLEPEEYWAEFFADKTVFSKGTDDEIVTWSAKNIAAADLVIGSLVREIRDLGLAGREIADIADLMDIDGPASAIVDKILVGLTEVKRAKYTLSDEFRSLGAGKRRKAVNNAVDVDITESREALLNVLKLADEDASDDMIKALFETFSMVKDVNTLTDFDNWARRTLLGSNIDGVSKTGVTIRELQGVMVNSVLSGPKTPVRAAIGTSTATFTRPLATALGGLMRGDGQTMRAALASLNAMMEAIPESFNLFKTKLNSYWAGDVATIKTRFSEYTKSDEHWELLGRWAETRGTAGDQAAFKLANLARSANDNRWFSYSTKIMASIDDSFGFIMGRAKAREKAFRKASDAFNKGDVTEITPELIRRYEDEFNGQIFDADGNLTDEAAAFATKEATLTQDLTGLSAGLNKVFNNFPVLKPFFLFARTGVNGLQLTAKHTPGFNFLVKEFNDIAWANADNLTEVRKYGITNATELANAKALQQGRLAIGTSLISIAAWSALSGNLSGDGPQNRQKRQMWIDGGWEPRRITIGGLRVSYDAIEPYNQIFAGVANVVDYSELMGPEWTEKNLLKFALVLGQTAASKSYLTGMQQFVDLFSGRRGQGERIIAGLLNNQIPLSSLRNEIGKVITPYMRELNSGIADAVRNRNLLTENIATDPLPIKYDILNGRPIKDHDFMTRMFNALSPIQVNLDSSPGRKLLFESGYDLRRTTYYSPDGDDLSDSNKVRSLFQKAIGEQNIELELNKLAKDEKVLASIELMNTHRRNGQYENDPMGYFHNDKIQIIFDNARARAWASILSDPVVQQIRSTTKQKNINKVKVGKESRNQITPKNLQPILQIYK